MRIHFVVCFINYISDNRPKKKPIETEEFSGGPSDVELCDNSQEKNDPTFKNTKLEREIRCQREIRIAKEILKPERSSKRSRLSQEKRDENDVPEPSPAERNKSNSVELDKKYVDDIKAALSREKSRSEKIKILTTLSKDISIRKMQSYFEVSFRMASKAKSLRKTKGLNTCPPKRKGRFLPESVKDKVINFYQSDDVSRMKPGSKDYVSVKTTKGREHRQTRLLLYNTDELQMMFIKKYPDIKISVSAFRKLRPKECLVVNTRAGMHNVCVCMIHQNVKLKFTGMTTALKNVGCIFSKTHHDALQEVVCSPPQPSCYFRTCKKCPGVDRFCTKVEELLTDHNISHVKYREWTSVDRWNFFLLFFIKLEII